MLGHLNQSRSRTVMAMILLFLGPALLLAVAGVFKLPIEQAFDRSASIIAQDVVGRYNHKSASRHSAVHGLDLGVVSGVSSELVATEGANRFAVPFGVKDGLRLDQAGVKVGDGLGYNQSFHDGLRKCVTLVENW